MPGTCALGYNSLRFDDEVTRYGLYRNFFDPYEREWKNGNSRWDMIDVVRLTRALRPEGINWPEKEPGVTSFRLEDLTAANDIEHAGAHDALVDVRATIAIARLVRARQPSLFDFVLQQSRQAEAGSAAECAGASAGAACLGALSGAPGLYRRSGAAGHASEQSQRCDRLRPARRSDGAAAPVGRGDPHAAVYAIADLPEGVERIPLKVVHINRAPVIVPMGTLTEQARERWQMDAASEQRHLETLRSASGLADKLAQVFRQSRCLSAPVRPGPRSLRRLSVRRRPAALRAGTRRCRRRIWPRCSRASTRPSWTNCCSATARATGRRPWITTERLRWEEYRLARLTEPGAGGSIVLDDYRRQLSRMAVDLSLTPAQRKVVDALLDWPAELGL